MLFSSRNTIHAFLIAILILATSCINKKQVSQNYICTSGIPIIDTLLISSESGNSELMDYDASTTDFIILKEDDNTMFADINQIIDAFDKYFIVDSYGSRRVVSFDHSGHPFASYGKHGNGPGEYIYPWDVDVNAQYVYILDISQRKLLRYNHKGDYIDSQNVPFDSKGFALLKNNKILFKLEPSKEMNYQLCVTDSALNPLSYMLHYPDGYIGGWVTDAVFQKNDKGISYYCSPADTIYRLDYDGNLIGKRLLNFKNGTIHTSAKINFIDAEQQGKLTSGMHLLNNPVELSNGTCFMEVTDYTNKGTYVIMLNPANGTHSAKKFADKMSIYDVIVPCVSSGNQIISYLDRIIADKCYNFDMMPDSLIKALNEGNRLLVIHNIH
ncbi:6-bladed beta-propeller [Phocaeicola faecium]|uniref:6-bladed beta-propeller n=1 Tax=Phocaeicola faecium TaxID=2762213 RepID=A0ABR8VDM4_9BACT|nr:6-bladed beta-propeller [Phocaeicola faecium]MBD8002877.1 6-bladed beta-propeller [Phocaeicola faecium]